MDLKISMDLDIIILGTRCIVRIKNEESVCTNIGALQYHEEDNVLNGQ
jgi:hypothetical protein